MENDKDEHIKRFGIIGYPLKHTLSPLIHNFSFQHYGLPYHYDTLETDPAYFEEKIQTYVKHGYIGFNVTIPFKETIVNNINHLSAEAKAIGAVNTVHIHNNDWYGYNTDAIGTLRTLEPYRNDINQSNVLILGAGGAARAVVYVLATYFHPRNITISARNVQRALSLSSLIPKDSDITFHHIFDSASDLEFTILTSKLIINTTPIGMYPNTNTSPLPETAPLSSNHIVFDVVYRPLKTALLKKAEEAGATILGGLPMLVHQGAEAFRIWTGKEMPITQVMQILQKKLAEEL
ncbi:MAG: shikimate dehydrogenase [Bacteroidetes bacterium]|nr:shikimate dehydrogenase [Bacteroidota bacterium]